MTPVLYGAFVFSMGLCVGSFLNVCIYRIPRGQSIVFPASYCPKCGKSIAWYDNIPVLGYILLGGKCRKCRQGISPRYPAIEFFHAAGWAWLYWHYGVSWTAAAGMILFSILLAVTMTDLETGYINDRLTFFGAGAGILLSGVFPELQGKYSPLDGALFSLLGLLAGGFLLYVTGTVGNWFYRRDTMGGGDVKLLAMMGAFMGPQNAFFIYLFAPVSALPFALFLKFFKRAETIPYGPFLAFTGMVFFLFGNRIIGRIFPTYGA